MLAYAVVIFFLGAYLVILAGALFTAVDGISRKAAEAWGTRAHHVGRPVLHH